MVIAVDGYSSTGKSTVAKLIASELGLTYIDTGAMYRAVTLFALRNALFTENGVDETRLEALLPTISVTFKRVPNSNEVETFLNGESVEHEIRGMQVSNRVSTIAAIGFVRAFLVKCQQKMGEHGNVILDGRDIGSVVFPNADVKFFITSTPEVRAQRRFAELQAKGDTITYEQVRQNVEHRDYMDTHRAESPLIQTPDAVVVDCSYMSVAEEVSEMILIIKERMKL